ncbi:MAG: YbhN family protein [Actinobacteria bacterium]|nr:YbhN family protein [Actinomycetota bacterium]
MLVPRGHGTARDNGAMTSPDGSPAGAVGKQAAGGGQAGPKGPKRPRHWLPHSVRRLAELLALGFVVEYLVVPQIGGTHEALHLLGSVNPFLPVLGLVLEALCLVAYFQLTRSLVPKGSDPGFATMSRIQLSTLGLAHCAPGGNAVGYSLGYRLLMKAGVGGADTGFTLSTLGIGSAVVLNVIFVAALVASLPLYGVHPLYLVVALAGLVLMGVVTGLVVALTKGDERTKRLLRALGTRLPYLHPDTLPKLFSQLVDRVRELSRDRRRMWVALGYAAANWLLDAGSLFVFLGAFGHWTEPVGLLVAYGVGGIAAALPITPGGLGVVEASVTSVLVALGTPRGIAIWGVLGWRLVNFWLPIPVGGLAYLSILVHPPAESQAGLAARRALWRERWRRAADFFAPGKTTDVLRELEDEMEEDLKKEVEARK